MKRIHTFDEFEAAAGRFRALMRQLYGERGATENLPQSDRTLGLLVIARRETPHTGELARDVADMRSTIHQLTNHTPLLCEADTWLIAEYTRLKSDKDTALTRRMEQAHKEDTPCQP